MSSIGVAKSEGIGAFFKMLFRTEKIDINDKAENLDEIQPNEEITEDLIEELKKSEKRISSLTEQYKIEKFEATPKISKKEKTKGTVSKSKKQEQTTQELNQEEHEIER